jgi:hypothetical protein
MTDQQTITLEKLKVLTDAGAVQHAEVVGVPGGWAVAVQVGMSRRMLRPNKKMTTRIFTTTDAALRMLREGGIRRVAVDQAGYAPAALF